MIEAGQTLPARTQRVTAHHIVSGAIASRDWAPQHHDESYARSMRLPGIIMNTPTQLGWYSAFVTNWAGPKARAARWRIEMKKPVIAGADLTMTGRVERTARAGDGLLWVWLRCRMTDDAAQDLGAAHLLFCIAEGPDADPWLIEEDAWAPPELQEL